MPERPSSRGHALPPPEPPGVSRPFNSRLVDLLRAARAAWSEPDAPLSIATHSDRWLRVTDISGATRAAAGTGGTVVVAATQRHHETVATSAIPLPAPAAHPIGLDTTWVALDDESDDLASAGVTGERPRSTLRARLLGRFEVELDGVEIAQWHGQLAPSILRYVLAQPKRCCGRDALLAHFWPGSDPYRARNRLHVALTGLRQALRVASSVNVIRFQDGVYRVSPDVDVTLDVDEFERFVAESRHAQLDGRGSDAAIAMRHAVDLYRGDFLVDAPSEAWAIATRESLRTSYLDTLDRLAATYVADGRDGEACEIAQLILQQDPCREDAHRMLMRAAANQGRAQEVARQYELCRRRLADHLGAAPAPVTTALYREARALAATRRDVEWGVDALDVVDAETLLAR